MKKFMKRWVSQLTFSSVVRSLAAWMFIVVTLTLPLTSSTMAKYVATGAGQGRARIAKWDPIITLDSSWPTTAQNKYVLFNDAIGMTDTYNQRTFTVKNNGETVINATPHLYNEGTTTDALGVTFSPASANIAIGATQSFTVNIAHSVSRTVRTAYPVELFVHVEQVD